MAGLFPSTSLVNFCSFRRGEILTGVSARVIQITIAAISGPEPVTRNASRYPPSGMAMPVNISERANPKDVLATKRPEAIPLRSLG